jgi:hypothetical protein
MTARFWEKYVDEAWGVVDERNLWQPNSPINPEALEAYLQQISHS